MNIPTDELNAARRALTRRLDDANNDARAGLETALEHGSHAWQALVRDGATPQQEVWPPDAEGLAVGSAAYHLAALLNAMWRAWQRLEQLERREDLA